MRDHCHILGTYRGAAHNRCNLMYRINPTSWKLPVVIHNLKGYDGHIIINAITDAYKSIRIIPTNMEKYMAFSIDQLQFIDSLQFTMKSLDSLVKTLDEKDFVHTAMEFKDGEELNLMKKKGIFPYDYFNDINRLDEMQLPNRRHFYSKLENKRCSLRVSLFSYNYFIYSVVFRYFIDNITICFTMLTRRVMEKFMFLF